MTAPRVVAVVGSRREESRTRVALDAALAAAADAGAETDCIDLGRADVPLYHPGEDEPGDVGELLARMRRADGVLVGSPVYHGSYASTFKNFHDYCGSDEFEGTVSGLLAVAGGENYEGTLEHMRATLRNVHSLVLSRQVGIPHASNSFEDGRLDDENVAKRLRTLGTEVTEYAERLDGESLD